MSLRRSTACARACWLLATKRVRMSTSTGATFQTKTQHALRRKRLCVTESTSSSRSRIRRRERRRPPPRKSPSSCCMSLPRSKTSSSRASLTLAAISPGSPALAITRRRNSSSSKNSCRDSSGSWCYSIRVIRYQDAGWRMSGRLRSSSSSSCSRSKLRSGLRWSGERVFSTIKPGDVDGVFVSSPELRTKFPSLILELTADRHLPLLGHRREWVQQGALFSYNLDLRSVGKAAARYVDKILKGTKPADLPVEQSSQLQLIINLKTAKALGLTIPQSLLVRADEIIQ